MRLAHDSFHLCVWFPIFSTINFFFFHSVLEETAAAPTLLLYNQQLCVLFFLWSNSSGFSSLLQRRTGCCSNQVHLGKDKLFLKSFGCLQKSILFCPRQAKDKIFSDVLVWNSRDSFDSIGNYPWTMTIGQSRVWEGWWWLLLNCVIKMYD